jgi:hypothetical protein
MTSFESKYYDEVSNSVTQPSNIIFIILLVEVMVLNLLNGKQEDQIAQNQAKNLD